MIYEKPKNEIFASDAKDGEIVEFPNVKRGWGVTENLGFIPPMEYFNAAFNRVDKSLAYQLQRGVGEWDKDLEYPIGAVVSLNGVVYVAKSQNTNKNPANEVEIWDVITTRKWSDSKFAKIDQVIGANQTTKVVTTQRAFNVFYENTTDKPIMLYIDAWNNNTILQITLYVTIGNTTLTSSNTATTTAATHTNITVLIPPKTRYKVTSNGALYSWIELS
ncbi:hypothetical protein [Campylobacter concisus]|uniref:hypothetical protein n=1 Tax=Campylobacter concisus TaxID=199 RepID=UPI000D6464F4|nr:hypothetical protein [Campylobacter concisus]